MKHLFPLLIFFSCATALAQTGIGTTSPASSALLDLTSTSKGFLPPRMTWGQIQAIQSPVAGLTVYDIGAKALRIYDGVRWLLIAERPGTLTGAPGAFGSAAASHTGGAFIRGVAMLADKSIVVVGDCNGTLALGGLSLNTINNSMFFAKLDSLGHGLFIKELIGTSQAEALCVEADATGTIYVAGRFKGSVDFDPSPALSQVRTSAGDWDGFVARYTAAGAYSWAKAYGSTGVDGMRALETDGTFTYAGGHFSGTVNFGGPVLFSNGLDGVVLKLSNAGLGSTTWATNVGGSGAAGIESLSIYSGGGVVAGGFFSSDVTFGATTLNSAGFNDGFVAFFNNLGNPTSAARLGGAGFDDVACVESDATGAVFVFGEFEGTANLALSGTADYTGPAGYSNMFLARYTPLLSIASVHIMSATGFVNPTAMDLDAAGNIFLGGVARSTEPVFLGNRSFTPASDAFDTFIAKVSATVGSSRVDLQACKLEYSIVSPK